MKRMITAGALSVAALSLAACGSSTGSTTAPATSPSVATTAAATAPAPPSAASTAPSPSAIPAAAALWCSAGGSFAPVTVSPSLSAWLTVDLNGSGSGYSHVQVIESALKSMNTPGVPAATLQAEGLSFCFAIADSEQAPPPVGVADYTKAMKDFAAGSHALHVATSSAGQASALAVINAGDPAFDAFLKAVGK